MDKTFDPKRIETRWASRWEARGYFSPSRGEAQTRDSYCIVIPPPNVTGSLHMGHAFQDTIMDMLVRFHRMRGDNTLWQVGTDHAGIATQMVVERQLAAEGSSGREIGRAAFVDRIWRWRAESGGHITRQLRRLGASVDWSREAFTMDDNLSRAVTEVFVQLFDEGLIYRGKRLVNWDPVLRTAVSDLEVISEAEQGHIWHLRYPIADSTDHLIVATTRPETMLGDTAVAVHPHDPRYRHLIGRRVRLPLAERTIPIIADDYVDREFGTGCLKITPAHDFNDHAVGQRHGLDVINVLTEDAHINDAAPAAYHGLSREQARERVVADLEAAGLLEKVAPHTLMVPRGDRTGTVIEPYLTNQWFVHAQPLAKPAIRAVEDGRIRFVPENWAKTYFEWMRNIQDWCISRQIWWGHRIPAWYDAEGNVYVGRDESQARQRAGLTGDVALKRDQDVLDTWFSSALWPFSTLGWPERTPEMAMFYPTSVLVTGFDIIFFWVARMIMMGMKFTGQVPFREVYVHGLVRDADGQKMSKSKGNVLDPIDLIDGIGVDALVEKRTRGLMQPHKAQAIERATRKQFPHGIAAFGTDALRFTFAALASNGHDIRFDLGRVAGYRNFCNKLWNAARYVRMQTEGQDNATDDDTGQTHSVVDRWIVSRLQRTELAVIRHMHSYRFDMAAKALYEFTWHEYCDWYLEMSKPVLQQRTAHGTHSRATRRTLVRVLEALLRLAHPFMPFITEEIWQSIGPLAGCQGETITLQPLPQPDNARIDANAEAEVEWIQGFILGVRQIRGEMDIAPGKQVPVFLVGANGDDRRRLAEHAVWLRRLAQVDNIRLLDDEHEAPQSATALLGQMKILVPMAGMIDKTEELDRLQKQIDKLDKELARSRSKLDNKQFTERAPAEIVHKEHRRLDEMTRSREELQAQRERIVAV